MVTLLANSSGAAPGSVRLPSSACQVRAAAYVRAEPAEIEAMRRTVGTGGPRALSPTFLKHADEQTVTGLAAMYAALARAHQRGDAFATADFSQWAIVGAPQFAGRLCCTAARTRFSQRGHGAVSLHLIPQSSLHSLSGAASVAFAIRGPNLGAGGGPDSLAEALLTVATLFDGTPLPGIWLLATAWDPEPLPDDEGRCTNAAVCHSLALALVPGEEEPGLPVLRWNVGDAQSAAATATAIPKVAELARRLGLPCGAGEAPAASEASPVLDYTFTWGLRVTLAAGTALLEGSAHV